MPLYKCSSNFRSKEPASLHFCAAVQFVK
uniref:Uncharacterized protein n=1 Tax=Pyricularia oryzae (strain P131) TaxID=1143193 RepID=L7ISF8_PYRO1